MIFIIKFRIWTHLDNPKVSKLIIRRLSAYHNYMYTQILIKFLFKCYFICACIMMHHKEAGTIECLTDCSYHMLIEPCVFSISAKHSSKFFITYYAIECCMCVNWVNALIASRQFFFHLIQEKSPFLQPLHLCCRMTFICKQTKFSLKHLTRCQVWLSHIETYFHLRTANSFPTRNFE